MPSGSTRRKIRHFSASLPRELEDAGLREIRALAHRDDPVCRPSASPAASEHVPVDVRREIVRARIFERVAAATAARVHGERPLGPGERMVEDAGGMAVVERRRAIRARVPAPGAAGDPARPREISRLLARLENDALCLQMPPQRLARRRLRPHETPALQTHPELAEGHLPSR